MEKSLLIILCLGFAACGQDEVRLTPVPPPRVFRDVPELPGDEDVKLIANEFYVNASALNKKVDYSVESISFVDTYGKCSRAVGVCETYTYADGSVYRKRVTLLRSYWDIATAASKRTLLYHELGHCALGLAHADPEAEAIMRPTVLPDELVTTSWYQLVKDLFSSTPKARLSLADEDEGC